MEYCEQCRQHWDWPKTDYGPITACELCGTRGTCYMVDAWKLPLPDHRRLQVLTAEEMPREWSDCMRVAAEIESEVQDMIELMAAKQQRAKKYTKYMRALNKIYFSGGLGDVKSG